MGYPKPVSYPMTHGQCIADASAYAVMHNNALHSAYTAT